MRLEARLRRLERLAAATRPKKGHDDDWPTEVQRLEEFARWGDEGLSADEPDFGAALAGYRLAIEEAKAREEPPYDPPDDFLPEQRGMPELRLLNWRNSTRFPELHVCWGWLSEMAGRWCDDVPPVTLEEFDALASWLEANGERVYQLAGRSGLIDLGGRKVSPANLRYCVGQGAEASGAGLLAQDLRLLKALVEGGSEA